MPVVSEDSAIEATANMTIYEQRLSHETVALLDSVLSYCVMVSQCFVLMSN